MFSNIALLGRGGCVSHTLRNSLPDTSLFRPSTTASFRSCCFRPSPALKSSLTMPDPPAKSSIADQPGYVGSRCSTVDYPLNRLASTAKFIEHSLALIGCDKQRPDNAHDIAYNDPIRYSGPGWRVDGRGPEEMRTNYPQGFTSKGGTDLSITNHIKGGMFSEQTGFVSFASCVRGSDIVQDLLERTLYPGKTLYKYQFTANGSNSFELDKTWHLKQLHTREAEVLTTSIDLGSISSVEELKGGKTTKYHYPFTPITGVSIDTMVDEIKPQEPRQFNIG